jgi:hypothetical protein
MQDKQTILLNFRSLFLTSFSEKKSSWVWQHCSMVWQVEKKGGGTKAT